MTVNVSEVQLLQMYKRVEGLNKCGCFVWLNLKIAQTEMLEAGEDGLVKRAEE